MNRSPCGDDEDLVRGITSAHYDQGDVSGKFFAGKAVSVNRLCRTNIATSLEIFRRMLSNPDKGVSLEGYATFKHLPLKEETLKYVSQNKDIERGFHVVVEQDDSIPDNPGHAEVMPRVPKGLANFLFDGNFFEIKMLNSA